MLVLTRKPDGSVMIGDDIEVRIIDVRGDKVRIGFEVPKNIPVHRREVYDAIKRGKQPKPHDDGYVERES